MNRIFLTTTPKNYSHSIESGLANNTTHFDHHKDEDKRYPSPCNNPNIKIISRFDIAISHIDADTLLGLARMCGIGLHSALDFNTIEKVDLNGSSILDDALTNINYHYMVGVSSIARELNFPRISKEEDIEVTDIIYKMLKLPLLTFLQKGADTINKSEKDYKDCSLTNTDHCLLISCDADDAINPSRGYEDGYDIIVVYRKHYKTVSLYAAPNSPYTLQGEHAGITFAGHDKACGSPRGEDMTLEDACKVFNAVCKITDTEV
mgnify:CR=1 FL=1